MYVDPTTIRLSDYFLLSDFMGCTSVYQYGMHNRFNDTDTEKLAEGKKLAEKLDEIVYDFNSISVVYGYISPSLSRKIVTYQDPNKPSYHRWDKGAAADICVHDEVEIFPPIGVAQRIEIYTYEFSRMITYAESEIICYASSIKEPDRCALYENRYLGKGKKPKFISYPKNYDKRQNLLSRVELPCDWRGKGWPSYHGGGKRQYEHYRLSRYFLLSDILYIPEYVHKGKRNPPLQTDEFWYNAKLAAKLLDAITIAIGGRVSIVRGYDRYGNNIENYQNGFRIEITSGTAGVHWADAASDIAAELGFEPKRKKMRSGGERLCITHSD
jgi:hypothetical protein